MTILSVEMNKLDFRMGSGRRLTLHVRLPADRRPNLLLSYRIKPMIPISSEVDNDPT
jgi:hypothetical protein